MNTILIIKFSSSVTQVKRKCHTRFFFICLVDHVVPITCCIIQINIVDKQLLSCLLFSEEYNYYCPPHCCGNEKPEKTDNYLLGHERQFNLGPPVRRTCLMPEKSPHPFAKYSNYMLDYRGSKIPPK